MAFNRQTSKSWLYNDLKEKSFIEKIYRNNLIESKIDCSSLKNYKSIASYNWHSKSTQKDPVIIIPGMADQLIGRLEANKQLTKSKYEQIADENRHFSPIYPIEPIFRAINQCSPDFDFKNVDFVTDRNNLRKLLNFVESECTDSFRIDFQKVANFIVMIRNEENSSQLCEDYGKDFEEKYTTGNFKQGGYRRVVSYQLGDHRFIVRFEVDCVADSSSVDDLAASMGGLSLNKNKLKKFENGSNLSYMNYGEFKPNEKLVELTTKSTYRGNYEFPMKKWNQLFFSNTDLLVIGWHSRGLLQKIEKLTFNDVTRRCNRTSSNIVSSISKLNNLLEKLKSIAIKGEDGVVFTAIYDHEENSDSCLKIYKCLNHPGSLPKEFINSINSK